MLKGRRCLIQVAQILQDNPQIVMGANVFRIKLQRLAIAVGCLGESAQIFVDVAQIVVSVRVARIDGHGLSVVLGGLRQ